MTLAEVLVALALLAGLVLVWRPVLRGLRRLPSLNEDMTLLQVESELSWYMSTNATVEHVGESQVTYSSAATGKGSLLEVRTSASGTYLQGSSAKSDLKPGMAPLIYNVSSIKFTEITPGRVKYELKLMTGPRLTGVFNDKTKR